MVVICEKKMERDVHESVHRDIIMNSTDGMQLYRLIYYSKSALHVSGDVFAVPANPWHQPAATLVNITRCCKYSQVFLIMGENIAQNM
jgi:hypothetical protein